jgi:hypothetical protein
MEMQARLLIISTELALYIIHQLKTMEWKPEPHVALE